MKPSQSATAIAPSSAERSGTVQSIDRAIVLLEAVSRHDGMRLTELARQVHLSLSTAHRLMTTLQQHGFVQCDPSTNFWHVGRRAYLVGAAFARPDNFVPGVMPFLRRLREQTGETISLGMADQGNLRFAQRLEGKGVARAIGQVGSLVPLTVSGMGKALLAVDRGLQDQGGGTRYLVAATPKSIRNRDGLEADLHRIRQQGFAVDDEECQMGLRCVAAVVYDQHAAPACAVSISGSVDRLDDGRITRLGELIREMAREMTTALGGHHPG